MDRERRAIELEGIPEVFWEALDHLVYMLRTNARDRDGLPPATVNGVPFAVWREEFYRWMREYAGGRIIDDSRYTIYDGDAPLSDIDPGLVWPGHYRHFKGGEYEVLGIARHSETSELMVVYRPNYGDRALWVRPQAIFTDTVIRDGLEVPRFQRLEDPA